MNRFRIEKSFAVEPGTFVFAGTTIEGGVRSGMRFKVPEAGHMWDFAIRSVEFIRKEGRSDLVGLTVDNGTPGYLPGLGIGWVAELYDE